MDRRQFLLTGLFSSFYLKLCKSINIKNYDLKFYSSFNYFNNNFFGCFNLDGSLKYKINLECRGHDIVIIKDLNDICLLTRRPNNKLIVINKDNGEVKKIISAPEGRHFYGHAAYNNLKKLLYVTENNYNFDDERSGVIAIYDPFKNYNRIGELKSNGIGPHEIKINKKGHLLVANGGVLTHPDYPKIKLNLYDIASNISIIEPHSGLVIKELRLEEKFKNNSIRHLDIDSNNYIYFACQNYLKDNKQQLPLIFSYYADTLKTYKIPKKIYSYTKKYSGSIKASYKDDYVYASFPRGNKLLVWNKLTARLTNSIDFNDNCGIGINVKNDAVYVSNGFGDIICLKKDKKVFKISFNNVKFDNHLSVIEN